MATPEIPVSVSNHAQWRAAERWKICHAEKLVEEVRECFAAKRVSPHKPPGVWNQDEPDCLYAWSECGRRVYVLTVNVYDDGTTFAIKTVLAVTP